jgi:DNA-binding transcriptional MerR regulator
MLNIVFQEEISLLKSLRKDIDTSIIGENIRKRQFTMKDAGISSRLLNHWEKSGLLMESYEERKWKKFNLIEYTWIRAVSEMRKYDLSHEAIRNAKDAILFDFKIKDLPDQKDFQKLVKEFGSNKKKEKIEELLQTAELKSQLNDFKINYLEAVILYIILLRGNYSLLVNAEGECIPFKLHAIDEYIKNNDFSEFLSGTFISISITQILRDFMIVNEFSLPKKRLALLSSPESQLIKTIREKDVVSVKVRKDNSNEIELIEEFRNKNIDKAARLMDIIVKHGYQTIEIKTQDGNIVHCSNLIKHKI